MGRRIESARQKTDSNKGQFAKEIGVSAPTYTGWISGKYSPSNQNMQRIVEITGESSSYFNPETLKPRNSIDRSARDFGAIAGLTRLKKLLQIPEAKLKRELDAVIGAFAVESASKRQRRK